MKTILFLAAFWLAVPAMAALIHGQNTTGDQVPIKSDASGNASVSQGTTEAGERSEDSLIGADYSVVSAECKPSASIDLSTDASTTVYNGPAVLCGVVVVVTVGTAAATVDDNTTMKYPLGIGIPVGSHDGFGAIHATSLVVNPADTSTGTVVIYYHPLDVAVTW